MRIRFNEELSPFLLQLRDRYNQIPLTHMLPMPSYNSQRLYEILWHDSHAGSKDLLTYEIDRLKVYIGLRDQQGKWEKYKPWKDFKKVLEKAIEDFNAHGSLRIKSYTGKRQSKRSYSHVLFRLEKIVPLELSKPSEVVGSIHPEVLALVGELEQSGYTQDPFSAIQTHGIEVVRQTLQLAREAERKAAVTNKPIYNVGGLIASMLKLGVATKRVTDLQKPARLSNQKAEQRARELVDAYQLALTEHANGVWAEMSEQQQREVHDHMRAELSGRLVEYLNTTGWQGRGYSSVRNTFLLDTYRSDLPDALADVQSFSMSTELLTQHSEEECERILVRACSLHADPEASDHATL